MFTGKKYYLLKGEKLDMKNKISVLIITAFLLTVITGAASAADWEMTGDFSIVGVELDAWNAKIDTLNTNVENYGAAVGAEYETMDNIDILPGSWVLKIELMIIILLRLVMNIYPVRSATVSKMAITLMDQ